MTVYTVLGLILAGMKILLSCVLCYGIIEITNVTVRLHDSNEKK